MIFVDSSAWFAIFSLRDANHLIATTTIQSTHNSFVTSDYVVDETLTLLRARGEDHRAIAFGKRVIEGRWAKIAQVEEADFTVAWNIFRVFNDKEWSFTDCTSYVLMKRLGITEAFAFDDHFRQFGTVTVVP